jgi:uncharacterized membrane protein YfcA
MSVISILLILLGAFALGYAIFWGLEIRKRGLQLPKPFHLAIGFVTDFLDTLGIGSFAVTTSLFKFWKAVPDEEIPGTLNVGHALPTIAEALIYIGIVKVDPLTLLSLIGSAIVGSWFGAGVVARWPRRYVQVGMGIALLAAAGLFIVNYHQSQGNVLGLRGTLFWIALAGNFVLGALMTLGIGLYAPCMIMLSLLGMNPKAAFPIMMGSCAFLMPVASARFIRLDRYSLRAGLGLAIGGIPGVLAAAFIVKSLDLQWVRWLVVFVVIYAAVMMLRSALLERRAENAVGAGAIVSE